MERICLEKEVAPTLVTPPVKDSEASEVAMYNEPIVKTVSIDLNMDKLAFEPNDGLLED